MCVVGVVLLCCVGGVQSRSCLPEFLYDLLLMQKGVDGVRRRAEALALNVMRTAWALQHTDPLLRLFVACVEEQTLEPTADHITTSTTSTPLQPPLKSTTTKPQPKLTAATHSSGEVVDSEALHFVLAVLSGVLSSDVGIEYGEPTTFGGVRWVCALRVKWINRTFFRAFGHAMQLRMCFTLSVSFLLSLF